MDEVEGSSPSSSTHFGHIDASLGYMLGGFVAGEGWFTVTRRPTKRADRVALRFRFGVTVASRDKPLLVLLRDALGYGSLHDTPPQRVHWLPTTTLTIASLRAHRAATIPFLDRFLLPCHKREQFEQWRDRLVEYDDTRPRRRRSTCAEPGCDGLVRGRGLCRSHYYRATGY